MSNTPESMSELGRNSVEAALDFAQVSMDSAERMLRLQLQAAKDFVAEQGEAAKAMAGSDNSAAAIALRKQLAEQAVDHVLDYSRGVCDVATQMQKQLTGLIEQHFAEYQRQLAGTMEKVLKSSPVGGDAAVETVKSTLAATQATMDNMTKAARHIAELADANVKAVTEAAATTFRSKK